MSTIKLIIPHSITTEFISDILVTAFEGASYYWIDKITENEIMNESNTYSDHVIMGGSVCITDNEDGEEHILNLNIFINGYKRYLAYCLKEKRTIYTDSSDIDSVEADCILQYVLFNDIIFG